MIQLKDRPELTTTLVQGHDEFFWHIVDQVLLRPDMLDSFRNEELRILTEDGEQSFLSRNGLPNTSVASDHLPLLFKLNR